MVPSVAMLFHECPDSGDDMRLWNVEDVNPEMRTSPGLVFQVPTLHLLPILALA